MITPISIDHVLLWVRSIPDTASYYQKMFGFKSYPKAGDPCTYAIESELIHFFICEVQHENEFLAKQHISFEVASLDEVIEKLDLMGVSDYQVGKVDIFQHKNYKWVEWRDPNEIRLECVEIIK